MRCLADLLRPRWEDEVLILRPLGWPGGVGGDELHLAAQHTCSLGPGLEKHAFASWERKFVSIPATKSRRGRLGNANNPNGWGFRGVGGQILK